MRAKKEDGTQFPTSTDKVLNFSKICQGMGEILRNLPLGFLMVACRAGALKDFIGSSDWISRKCWVF